MSRRRAVRPPRPFYKELSDEALTEAYRGTKALVYNGAWIKDPNLGRMMRDLDLIIAVARKRGLQLPV